MIEFSAVEKRSAHEAIVAQIERAIDDGELRPGDRLPGERRLMEQFGVSRPTVREAMRVLQATGVVSAAAGDPRGPEVLAYSPRVFRGALARLARAESMTRVELLQFRMMLEATGCLLAARHRTDTDLARMRSALSAFGRTGETAGIGAAADAFQATIRQACGNRLIEITGGVLAGAMRDVADRRLAADTDRTRRLRVAESYAERVHDAVATGDGPRAARLVQEGIHAFYADDLTDEESAELRAVLDDPR